jgi:hypothetical protein
MIQRLATGSPCPHHPHRHRYKAPLLRLDQAIPRIRYHAGSLTACTGLPTPPARRSASKFPLLRAVDSPFSYPLASAGRGRRSPLSSYHEDPSSLAIDMSVAIGRRVFLCEQIAGVIRWLCTRVRWRLGLDPTASRFSEFQSFIRKVQYCLYWSQTHIKTIRKRRRDVVSDPHQFFHSFRIKIASPDGSTSIALTRRRDSDFDACECIRSA